MCEIVSSLVFLPFNCCLLTVFRASDTARVIAMLPNSHLHSNARSYKQLTFSFVSIELIREVDQKIDSDP